MHYIVDNSLATLLSIHVTNSLVRFPPQSLTGTIPEELGDLESVVNVYLHENHLSGKVPSNLHQLERLGTCPFGQQQLVVAIKLRQPETHLAPSFFIRIPTIIPE